MIWGAYGVVQQVVSEREGNKWVQHKRRKVRAWNQQRDFEKLGCKNEGMQMGRAVNASRFFMCQGP